METMSVERETEIARGAGRIRPIGVLGAWAMVLMAGTVVMQLVSAIVEWADFADFQRSWGQPQEMRKEWQSSDWADDIELLLLAAAGIIVIVWLWRARSNAETLCAARHRLSPGWVIGGWFCPIVNFWFPHMIVADVVRASDPRTPADAPDLRGRSISAVVTAWWLCFVINWILSFVALPLSMPEVRTQDSGDYFAYSVAPRGGWGLVAVDLLEAGALAGAAISLAVIMIRVQRWQEARA